MLQKLRRDRKLIRDLKADMLVEKFDADIDTDFTFFTIKLSIIITPIMLNIT